MRTVIAPLLAEVEAELVALDARLQDVARRYVRRLALEPFLGPVVSRGPLAAMGARRVYFDRDSQPDDLFRSRRPLARRGDQDLSEGPRWRIVYWIGEAGCAQTRIVVILAVGLGHADPPNPDAYQLAARRLRALTSVASTRRRVK